MPSRTWKLVTRAAQLPLYPLFVNLYFVSFFYQANHFQLLITDTFDYLIFSTLLMVLVIAATKFLPVGYFALVGVAMFFAFIYFALPLRIFYHFRDGGPILITHLLWGGLFFVIGALVCIRRGRFARRISLAFNIWALLAVLWSVGGFAYQYLSQPPPDFNLTTSQIETGGVQSAPTAPVRPHIVHIMLDGYARADVLAQDYGFDNSGFLAALAARGFKVATGATTPYNQTSLSLAATFQGGYVDPGQLGRLAENDVGLRRRLLNKVTDGPVHDVLQQQGYRFFATPVGLTGFYRYPDETMQLDIRPREGRWTFEHALLYRRNIKSITPLTNFVTWRNLQRMNRDLRFSFDYNRFGAPIAAALAKGTPIHLFQHFLAPHPPFTITMNGDDTKQWLPVTEFIATGNAVTLDRPERRQQYAMGYLEKLRYTNRVLLEHIDRIIAAIPEPRVIIIQSDHGGSIHYNHDDRERVCIRERYGTLFAVQASPVAPFIRDEGSGAYNTVNIYRDIFAGYFHMPTPPLPAKSYYAAWSNLRRFTPVDMSSAKACAS